MMLAFLGLVKHTLQSRLALSRAAPSTELSDLAFLSCSPSGECVLDRVGKGSECPRFNDDEAEKVDINILMLTKNKQPVTVFF